jgi:hypothetical protein
MNIPLNQFGETQRATIMELLGILSESLVEAKTPMQRLAILDEMGFLFAQLFEPEQTDA